MAIHVSERGEHKIFTDLTTVKFINMNKLRNQSSANLIKLIQVHVY